MNNPNLSIYKKNKIFKDTYTTEHKKKRGRKLKEGTPMNQKITVNFTESERVKLEKLSSENQGVPIATLIRNACKNQGII